MDLTVLDYTVIAFTGFFTGFINTIAAAGSLLQLPLLIFMGLPANEANATNRLAIFCQSIVGVLFFKQKNLLNIKSAMYLTIPCMLGSFVGAVIAIDLDEALLRKTIGIIMLIMMAVLFLKPEQWLKGKADKVQTSGFSVKEFTACFLIGVYGGFIQAGRRTSGCMGLADWTGLRAHKYLFTASKVICRNDMLKSLRSADLGKERAVLVYYVSDRASRGIYKL
ncbi:hypothetical protein CHS0354_006913 [Potamilus streckersoni]|uniref:Membrane transporter protein n=1 Tax=Potamilus streckersoni TaxID=2493646 RepID=A0AAE0TEE7_9BIVA|nr:hypothetical protein CHS0354_006913 [Potamilus streckersoni]